MNLAIIIPLANEEATIFELCEDLKSNLNKLKVKYSVYFVIDKVSKDNTKKILNDYITNNESFNILWAPNNKNVVDAYINGYKKAFSLNHDYFIEMDGGFSHLPCQIMRITDKLKDGYDCVYGSRFIDKGEILNSNPKRLFYSKFGTIISNILLKTNYTDATSGYQGFNRKTLERLLSFKLLSEGHFYQTEVKFLLKKMN